MVAAAAKGPPLISLVFVERGGSVTGLRRGAEESAASASHQDEDAVLARHDQHVDRLAADHLGRHGRDESETLCDRA
jgi:hypothetical protein